MPEAVRCRVAENPIRDGLNFPNRKFGDLIYWAEKGWMIHPDFWNARRRPVGMHGYRREVNENHGGVIFHCTEGKLAGNIESVEMADIFQTGAYSLFGHSLDEEGVYGSPIQRMVTRK